MAVPEIPKRQGDFVRGASVLKARRMVATFLWIASLASCDGLDGLTVEEHAVVDRWLLCDECVDGELDSVLTFQNRAVGRLRLALLDGPTPGRISMMELKLRENYGILVRRLGPNPMGVSEAQYVDRHLDNYRATYQSRSAVALGRIGSSAAIDALQEALSRTGYRADVIETIREVLSDSLTIIGGNNQTASVATTLPDSLEVLVTDGSAPVGSVPVSFAVQTGDGVLFGGTPRTDPVTGRAHIWWTLGPVPSPQTVQVTAGDQVRVFSAIATPTLAIDTVITPFAGLAQRAPAGTATPIAPVALVTNGATGNPLSGVTVTFSAFPGSGSVIGGTVPTNASGLAALGSWVLGPTVGGQNRLVATISSGPPSERDSAFFTAVASGPRADTLVISDGDGQAAAANTAVPIPPAVLALDASGNPLPGVAVSFFPFSGGGTVTGNSQTTDATGVATIGSWTLGPTASANELRAAALNVPSVTFTATALPIAVVPVTVTSGLPPSGVGLEVVRLTAGPGFAFAPTATVTSAGPGISSMGVAVDDPGGTWIEYVPRGGSTGTPTISGVEVASVPGSSLSLPADEAVAVPPTTFTGTDAQGTAPTIAIPADGMSTTFYDGGPFGAGIFGADRIYNFTLAAGTTFVIDVNWSNAADVDILLQDNPSTGFVCGFGGATGAQPEQTTCTALAAGNYSLVLNLYAGSAPGVLEVTLTTP